MYMQKVLLLSFLAGMLGLPLLGFRTHKEGVRWMRLEEVEAQLQTHPKPVLIDVYTDWCGWCKVMDKKTYARNDVATYINEKMYPVKFNAESKEPVTWMGKTYRYNPARRIHEFALYLITGEMAFPNTVILPAVTEKPQSIAGFLEPKDMEMVVKYFGEGYYKKRSFDNWARNFKPTWK